MRSVALLRGVNVGGARRLSMASLERAFRAAGATRAEPAIQSGNVVFEAGDAQAVAAGAARAIEAESGFRPATVLRGAALRTLSTLRNWGAVPRLLQRVEA